MMKRLGVVIVAVVLMSFAAPVVDVASSAPRRSGTVFVRCYFDGGTPYEQQTSFGPGQARSTVGEAIQFARYLCRVADVADGHGRVRVVFD